MENFTLWQNTKLIFGKNTEDLVGEETKKHAKKILLHYGQSHIKKSGLKIKKAAIYGYGGVSGVAAYVLNNLGFISDLTQCINWILLKIISDIHTRPSE